MKTLFNNSVKSTSLAIILAASVFTFNASAAPLDAASATISSALETVNLNLGKKNSEIKRVIVTGNTKVLLIQSKKEYVTMETEDLAKVKVTQLGNALTISSNESSPVVVTVYVNNPYRISASDKACVKTLGNFDLVNLQVMLKDEATAKVKVTTRSIYTVINDRANLQLIGTSARHIYEMADIAKIDTAKFAAVETENAKSLQEAVALNVKKRTN
jgi:hypothetical protein